MSDWLVTADALRERDEAFVMVTVAATRGSTPREAGARMLVTGADVFGTIGGGQLEYECTRIAAESLVSDRPAYSFRRRFTLGADCGQCCGGVAEILFEQIEPGQADWIGAARSAWDNNTDAVIATVGEVDNGVAKYVISNDDCGEAPVAVRKHAAAMLASQLDIEQTAIELPGNIRVPALFERLRRSHRIVIFGAGHVGSALVHVLAPVHCTLTWIDSRHDIFPDVLPANVTSVTSVEPQALVEHLSPGSYVLVMTHSHAQDLEICARILARGDMDYCGLIGSVSKRRQFERRLRKLGLDEQQLSALTCPIGADGIAGKQPAQIAIAVAAQLLALRDARQAGTTTIATAERAHR